MASPISTLPPPAITTLLPITLPLVRQFRYQPLPPIDEYRPSYTDAKDAIAFAAVKMKEYYDQHYRPIYFNVGDTVKLRLHKGYNVPGVKSHKLGPQFCGPFEVIERIGQLVYRIKLPDNMKIHNVISVVMLEPCPKDDPYGRRPIEPPPVIVDGEEEHFIEKIINKRRIRKGRGWSI